MRRFLLQLLFFLLLLPANKALAQLEGNMQYISYQGIIDFNCGVKSYQANHAMKSYQSRLSSSIADSNGNLLFYVFDNSVFTKTHKFMQGGERTLSYDTIGPAEQTTWIVPHPADKNKYYIFFRENTNGEPRKIMPTINYAIVDISLNDGLGKVIEIKRDLYPGESKSHSSPIFATKHRNRTDSWVCYWDLDLVPDLNSDSMGFWKINKLHVSAAGISRSQSLIRHTGANPQTINFSPDGKKLFIVYAVPTNYSITLYNFNNETVEISNPIHLKGTAKQHVDITGTFFSPDGTKLYVCEANSTLYTSSLYQYEVAVHDSAAIAKSRVIISSGSIFKVSYANPIIGPNGKFYLANYDENEKKLYFTLIEHPNEKAAACNYRVNVIENNMPLGIYPPYFLTRKPWIAPFQVEGHCQNQPVYINPWKSLKSRTYRWYYGDGDSTNESVPAPHIYKTPGKFIIKLIADDPYGKIDTYAYSHCIFPTPKHVLLKDTLLCAGDTLHIDAGNEGATYLWSDGDTSRYKTIKNTQTLCLQTIFGDCAIWDTIKVTFLTDTTLRLGKDVELCLGDSFVIHSGHAATKWSTGEIAENIIIKKPGIYIATLENPVCTVHDTIKIDFLPQPFVDLGKDTTICEGSGITLIAGDNISNYLWSSGDKRNAITVTEGGTYWVYKWLGKCNTSDTIHIATAPLPKISLGKDSAVCFTNDKPYFTLHAGISATNYIWNTGETTQTIQIQQEGVYTVAVTNSYGCQYQDSILIKDGCQYDVYVPDAFSPNDDNINDVFKITAIGIAESSINIYNRWGEKIYSNKAGEESNWDGKFKSVPAPEGLYFYTLSIHRVNGKTVYLNGTIKLIR